MLEPAIQDKRHWWHREDLILLILLGLLFLLPGLHRIPLFDRDEPRFAVAARTMQETGDYIVPHFNGALRPDKPPLVYWLMDLGYYLTGGPGELGARLPSALCAVGTLIVTYFMAGARFGRLTGFISAMMLGSSALFVVEGRLATADSTMVFFISLCMACAWQAWDAGRTVGDPAAAAPGLLPRADFLLDRTTERISMLDHLPLPAPRRLGWPGALLFWIALAAGTLTKGVPLLFVLLPMIVLSIATGALPTQLRQWRSHFHVEGRRAGISLAIVVAVFALFMVAEKFPALREWRLLSAILGLLLIGMILTPGLPGVLFRCLFSGNWAWWRPLRLYVGVPLLILLVGWWVLLAGQATHWKLIADMVGNHFLNRAAGPLLQSLGINLTDTTPGGTQDPMKAYGQPPGFYLLTVWGTFWPWSILFVPAAFHVVRRLRGKTPIAIDPRPYQFLVAWIIPLWLCLELSRGKLFHYPLPFFIPLAILCADALVQSWHRLTDVLAAEWFAALRWAVLIIWLGMGITIVALARLAPDTAMFWRCFPFAACLMATGIVGAITWGKPAWPYILVLAWGGSLLVADIMILGDLPELQVSRLAGHEMAYVRQQNTGMHMGVLNYEEATLVFYSGENVQRFNGFEDMLRQVPFERADEHAEGASASPQENPYVITIDEGSLAELDHRGIRYARVSRIDLPENLQTTSGFMISGFNPATFKPVKVGVITNVIPKPAATTQATTSAAAQPSAEQPSSR